MTSKYFLFEVAFDASLMMFAIYQWATALHVITFQSHHSSRYDNAKRNMCRSDETLRRCVYEDTFL